MKQRRRTFAVNKNPGTKVYKKYEAISRDVPSFPKKAGLNTKYIGTPTTRKGQSYRSLPTKAKTNNITAVAEKKLYWPVQQRKIFKPNS